MTALEYFKENSGCLYIYNLSSSVYGLKENEFSHYIIIINDKFIYPEDWIGLVNHESDYNVLYDNNTKFTIYKIKDWFDYVLNGNIICWECSCLNKKFVIKEHVKLLMTTNPLQLRKQVDKDIANISGKITLNESVDFTDLWRILVECKFANQIIENHKIVNFKETSPEYYALRSEVEDADLIERYAFDLNRPYTLLRERTDDLLKRDKIKKILQNE